MALIPTIKVGGELIWLDQNSLAKGELSLDRESISEQCDGCGRDIMETGEVVHGPEDKAVKCTECNDHYPIVFRDGR